MHVRLTSLSNTITPTSLTPLPATLCLTSPPYEELLVQMEASFFSQRPSRPCSSNRMCSLDGGGGRWGWGGWKEVIGELLTRSEVTSQGHSSRRGLIGCHSDNVLLCQRWDTNNLWPIRNTQQQFQRVCKPPWVGVMMMYGLLFLLDRDPVCGSSCTSSSCCRAYA